MKPDETPPDKTAQVRPIGRTIKGHKAYAVGPVYRSWSFQHRTWTALFVAVLLLCLAWALWLLVLAVSPNSTINHVMHTDQLDNGAFWLVFDPPVEVVVLGIAGRAIIGVGYLWVLFAFAEFSRKKPCRTQSSENDRQPPRLGSRIASSITKVWPSSTKAHQRVSLCLKTVDLLVQCVFIAQLLEAGMPLPLVAFFTSIVVLNAAIAVLFTTLPMENMGVTHLVVDVAIDFIIAIVYPMTVLLYSIATFAFDRQLMDISMRTFNSAAFERIAAVVADPASVAIIRRSFDSLRIISVLDLFTRVGVNLALCVRFRELARLVAESKAGPKSRPNGYPKHRGLSAAFALVALAVLVVTSESVRTAAQACAPHHECVQYAHRWIKLKSGDLTQCPCIAIIDRELYVPTYNDWTHPIDRTEKVRQLSTSGDLVTLDLVNRGLAQLPATLRGCSRLRHIALMYTDTTSLPEWMSEFSELEYVHIEGKLGRASLQALPDNLFANTKQLALLHFGQHELQRLPNLDNVPQLQAITLGLLPELEEIPSFRSLSKLRRLTLAYVPNVNTLPDLTPVRHLEGITSYDRGAFCCNGFLAGKCDLTHQLCLKHPAFGTPPATCLPPERQATPATLAYFEKFSFGLCIADMFPMNRSYVPTADSMRPCEGILFRQCEVPGTNATAVCYNTRWMAVECQVNPFAIAMRRQQIAEGRGLPCDPAHEAWLGCPL